MTTYKVNEFNEVVPVNNGRVSNSAGDRRELTNFEKLLLDDIKNLEDCERENLKIIDELKEKLRKYEIKKIHT